MSLYAEKQSRPQQQTSGSFNKSQADSSSGRPPKPASPYLQLAYRKHSIPQSTGPNPKLQTKLTITTPDDNHEQEADRAAEQVMRMPDSQVTHGPQAAAIQPVNSNGKKRLQAKDSGASHAAKISAPPLVQQALSSPGQPLDRATRSFMEPRFGQDFSAVRLHTDNSAAHSARALNASAFTVGGDVVFGEGRYAPESVEGRALLAHELAHVVQQADGQPRLARKTSQYETRGQKIDPADLVALDTLGYWQQKIKKNFLLGIDPAAITRFNDREERDAVGSAIFSMLPSTAITQAETHIVKVPKRTSVSASKDVMYQVSFSPTTTTGKLGLVEILFVTEGTPTNSVAAPAPTAGYTSTMVPNYAGFPPGGGSQYWQTHQDEKLRVFNWIEKQAPTPKFDQVLTTTISSGGSSRSASFLVSGNKDASGRVSNVVVIFLGGVLPVTKTAATGYASHDFADASVEEAQATSPTRTDKLGTINNLAAQPVDEQASVKYAISRYAIDGAHDAEVDAIVPILSTTGTPKRVLYTFRFTPRAGDPKTSDVDIQRIGEENKDVTLTTQGDLARVNGYQDHLKDAKTLKKWLKDRYPGVTPTGTTIADIEKDVTATIRAQSGTPIWFEKNYKIKILDIPKGEKRLQDIGFLETQEWQDVKDFTPAELRVVELVLEMMSDNILEKLERLQMVRQKVFQKWISAGNVQPQPQIAGITVSSSKSHTTIMFDQAAINAEDMFLGGTDPAGQPAGVTTMAKDIAHELGHTMAHRPGVQKAFDKLVRAKGLTPITWYAGSNPPKEFLPEAYALYYTDPEWLKQNWLDLYTFFQSLDKKGKP